MAHQHARVQQVEYPRSLLIPPDVIVTADTLAEWIDVLETGSVVADDDNAAFELGGNTYFFQDNTTATGGNDIIELTGVTGITAIDITAAANTILIA